MRAAIKLSIPAIIFLCSSLLLLSCRKASTETLNEVVHEGGAAKFTGSFSGVGNQKVSGAAKIYFVGNRYQLMMENFRTDNGPDLKVNVLVVRTP